MKILFWTELFWPYIGGVEVLSMQLITALQERGYEFSVVAAHGELDLADTARHQNITIQRFPFLRALLHRNLKSISDIGRQVFELKQAYQPDLIHLNSGQPGIFFHQRTEAAWTAPTLFTVHAPLEFGCEPNSLLGRVLQSADWVAAVSSAMLQDVRQLVPEVGSRSSVIHNGLHMPSIDPVPLSFDPPRLLCVGRVVPDKGFDLALSAFSLLLGRFPQARLLIAGDGEARLDLEQQAARLKIQDSVDFMGWVDPDEVPELMNSAAMVIMPSRWREPFGLVALQAAQMARPIVATRVGGLPEVVAHGQTGLLVDKEDSAALAESIALLLENPGVAAEMGLAARKRAQTEFGFQHFVDAYDALYKKIACGTDAL